MDDRPLPSTAWAAGDDAVDMTAWLVVTIISFIGCALYLRSRIGRVTLLDTIRAYQMPSIDHLDFPEPSTRTYMVHPAVHLRSSSWCMDRLRSGLETGIDLDHDLRRAAHDPNTDILQGLRMGPSEIRQRRSPERERPEREHPLDPGLGVRASTRYPRFRSRQPRQPDPPTQSLRSLLGETYARSHGQDGYHPR